MAILDREVGVISGVAGAIDEPAMAEDEVVRGISGVEGNGEEEENDAKETPVSRFLENPRQDSESRTAHGGIENDDGETLAITAHDDWNEPDQMCW